MRRFQVANTHYKQMAKPDRDRTEAKAAEEEYQTFLEKYPKDPLAPQAEQRLRNVQEIIAEGDYRIGYYYYVKGDKRAAAARLIAITKRYPLYSKSDHALWMLGDIFERSEHKEIASLYYCADRSQLSAVAAGAGREMQAESVQGAGAAAGPQGAGLDGCGTEHAARARQPDQEAAGVGALGSAHGVCCGGANRRAESAAGVGQHLRDRHFDARESVAASADRRRRQATRRSSRS